MAWALGQWAGLQEQDERSAAAGCRRVFTMLRPCERQEIVSRLLLPSVSELFFFLNEACTLSFDTT